MAKLDEEEDLGFYLAPVLNFPLGLGAMTKGRKRKETQKLRADCIRRIRYKITCKFKNYMMHDI